MSWPAVMPVAPLAVGFAGGVAASVWLPASTPWVVWGGGIAVAAVLLLARCERSATVTLLTAVVALGALRAAVAPLPPHHLAAVPLPSTVQIEGRLAAEPRARSGDDTQILLDANALVTADTRRVVTGRIRITLNGTGPPLTEGQRIAGEFRVYPPQTFRNPGGFDYRTYLARRDIYLLGSGHADRVRPLEPEAPPWRVRVKRWAVGTIRSALPSVSAALLTGLLLGDRGELPAGIQDAFRRAGVYHVLAVSGFNVALLASAAFATLALLRLALPAAAAIALAVVVAFATVVGTEPSVLRAVIMAVLMLLALILSRESPLLNSLALAALLILAVRPGDLVEPGFQLSFGATLGILLFYAPARDSLTDRGWPRWLAEAIAVSASAQVVVTPIMLTHFNQLSLIGILSNLAVVPLAAIATVAGLLALLASAIHESLARPLFDGVWLVLLALRACVHGAARVPGAMLHLPSPPWAATLAFYAGLGLLLWSATQRHRVTQRLVPFGGIAAALVVTAVITELWPLLRPADGRLRLTFLDVGQGDAIAVELPDGRTLLVDAGPGGGRRLNAGERVVAPFLWNRGVHRLTAVIATHDDVDHAGGVAAIRRLFRVDELWTAGTTAPGRRWLGNVPVTVLAPPEALRTGSASSRAADRNNGGIVIRIDHGLLSFLLTADIESEAEAYLRAARAPLRVTVLKVAHHGGRRSTGEAFLAETRPALAVISVGGRNRFGHPAPETLARLREAGARVYRTDQDGAVMLESDGQELIVTAWADRRTERFVLYPSNERSI